MWTQSQATVMKITGGNHECSVQQKRKYDPEFKKSALLLLLEAGRTIPEVAENLEYRTTFSIGGVGNYGEMAK